MQFQANSEPSASVLIDTRTDVRRDCFSRVFLRPTGVETPSRPVSFVVDSVPERAHAAPRGAVFDASIEIQEALASRLFCLRNAAVRRSSEARGFSAESDYQQPGFKVLRE